MASNGGDVSTPSEPPNVECATCGSPWHAARVGIQKDGTLVWVCDDLVACSRRALARQGVKLRPHPKNPERCVLVE